jgi:peptidoglycan/LPS O-acetylase OafA/YrhL
MASYDAESRWEEALEKLIDFYSVWPALVCVGAVLLLARSPVCRYADTPPSYRPRRIVTMDGLRGFLAMAVVLHHVAIYHQFLQQENLSSGGWVAPPSRFYAAAGPAGVSMFFMITGYLFWSRLIEERGRPAWGRLYVGRIFRIGPLYLAGLGAASLCDWVSRTPVAATSGAISGAKEVATWSLLGLSVYPDRHEFLAGVTWSIQDEWLFYLSLPVLAVFVARSRRHLEFSLALLAACLALVAGNVHHAAEAPLRTHLMRAALFFAGMVCGSLHRVGIRPAVPDWLASSAAAVAVAAVLLFRDVYGPGPLLLLGAAFFLIASGCSLWGLLRSRAAIRLGDVSYGIYLVQGLVLAGVFRPRPLREFALGSPWHHWALALAAMLLLAMVATATHVWIERPGITLGKRVAEGIARAGRRVRTTVPM